MIALIYFLLRAISSLSPLKAVGLAIAAGFLAETLQYVHLAERLNLTPGSPLYIVIGNTYSPTDLVMYVVGGVLALVIDQYLFIPRAVK